MVIKSLIYITKEYGKYQANCESETHVRQWDERRLFSLLEEKFEIENMIKIPYINSFNMDNLFVSAILR